MKTISALDRAVYRAERALAGLLFLAMAVVMFLYVIHKIYDRAEGRLPIAAMGIYEGLGGQLDAARIAWFQGPFSTGLNLVIMAVLVYGVVRTRKSERTPGRPVALGLAVVGAGLIEGFLRLLVWVFPGGPEWAPAVALLCMLWVGFLGSSIATYERRHLGIELADKIWPARVAPVVRALAWAAAAGLCFFVLYLAWISLADHFGVWSNNHLNAILSTSAPIPKWFALLVVPYAMLVMGARIVGQTVRAITHPEDKGGGEILPGLGESTEGGGE